jgi:hypothetical protein
VQFGQGAMLEYPARPKFEDEKDDEDEDDFEPRGRDPSRRRGRFPRCADQLRSAHGWKPRFASLTLPRLVLR